MGTEPTFPVSPHQGRTPDRTSRRGPKETEQGTNESISQPVQGLKQRGRREASLHVDSLALELGRHLVGSVVHQIVVKSGSYRDTSREPTREKHQLLYVKER
jgi:hypothetical protein